MPRVRGAYWLLGIVILAISCGRGEPTGQIGQGERWGVGEDSGSFSEEPDRRDASPDEADMAGDLPDLGPRQLLPDNTGVRCKDDLECSGGSCFANGDWPEGYCTQADCRERGCLGERDVCVDDPLLEDGSYCAIPCTVNIDCREGYRCEESSEQGVKVCTPVPRGERADGEPCELDGDCAGGSCIEDPEWPSGYCTTLGCETFQDCSSSDGFYDNRCLQNRRGGQNYCVRICTADDQCRRDYVCQRISRSQGACFPDPSEPFPEELFDEYPFEIQCQMVNTSDVELDYAIAADTTSYMVVPFAADGRELSPSSIALPDGDQLSFSGDNAFQAIPARLHESINPTVIPATDAFASQLQGGAHSYRLRTNSQQICYYVLEESSPGTVLDMNIYLVGLPGVTAASAPDDANMQQVLDRFEEVYGKAGIRVGKTRFFELSEEQTAALSVVRRESDIDQLAALSKLPGPTRDDALSVNIFFVERFAMRGGAIGISLGLPGPAGLHGTKVSGVVFTGEFFGQRFRDRSGELINGNQYTGIVLAHEVGHYLGLFHTTEQTLRSFDPLDDTPRCTNPRSFPGGCPDWNNLMFPLAGVEHTELSAQQGRVIQVNPLTKEASAP